MTSLLTKVLSRGRKREDPGNEVEFFRTHRNEKSAFSNFFGLKSVYQKLNFRDGLVVDCRLTVDIKLRFQISLAKCRRCLKLSLIDKTVLSALHLA